MSQTSVKHIHCATNSIGVSYCWQWICQIVGYLKYNRSNKVWTKVRCIRWNNWWIICWGCSLSLNSNFKGNTFRSGRIQTWCSFDCNYISTCFSFISSINLEIIWTIWYKTIISSCNSINIEIVVDCSTSLVTRVVCKWPISKGNTSNWISNCICSITRTSCCYQIAVNHKNWDICKCWLLWIISSQQ